MESTESFVDAVDDFEGAVIIVTHSEMILHSLATRLIVFDNGRATLFEGTYQDFLDRVGWKDESDSAQQTTGAACNSKGPVNKKHLRRKRAELINDKSRVLGVLQDKIEQSENTIMRLEAEVEQNNRGLLEASVKGDGETIKQLLKDVHNSKSRIDVLFSELELLHMELDSKKEEFEKKLKAANE
jgi:ATP-binding cassette subfamily F protein 3